LNNKQKFDDYPHFNKDFNKKKFLFLLQKMIQYLNEFWKRTRFNN